MTAHRHAPRPSRCVVSAPTPTQYTHLHYNQQLNHISTFNRLTHSNYGMNLSSAKTGDFGISVGDEMMTLASCSFLYNTRAWQIHRRTDRQTGRRTDRQRLCYDYTSDCYAIALVIILIMIIIIISYPYRPMPLSNVQWINGSSEVIWYWGTWLVLFSRNHNER